MIADADWANETDSEFHSAQMLGLSFLRQLDYETRSVEGASLVERGPDELVHVSEKGKYFDHVYHCDHEKLYSLDDLEDEKTLARLGLSGERYAKLSPVRRVEAMPFFRKQPLAVSLKACFDGLRIVTKAELRPTPPAAAPTMTYLETAGRGPRKFWMLTVSGADLVIRSGRRGTLGRTRIQRCSSAAQARAAAGALVADMHARGYR